MQPLMNMITFNERNRACIFALHTEIADGLEAQDSARTEAAIGELATYTVELATSARNRRDSGSKT